MHLHGQALVDFYRLDTVVFNRKLNGINPRSSTVSTCNATHLFYLNKSRNKATDTLTAYRNDLTTKEAIALRLKIPGYSSLSSRYDIVELTANERYLGVALSDRIELFDLQKGIGSNGLLTHAKTIALSKEYTFYKIVDNRTIILGDCYNYSKKSNKPQTELAVLDIASGKVQKEVTGIDFKAIEFTHFNPKHFIDASNDCIAFAQTARYEITLFDRSLNKADVIKRSVANWKEIDNFLLDNIRESFDPNNIVPIIDTLSYYDDHDLSRLEGIWFMGDNRLMVRYTMNIDGKKNRYYDVYAKNGKDWALKDSNILEIRIPVSVNDTITKDNFLIWPSNYHTVIHENGIVMIRNYADIPYLSDTWKNIYKKEQDYYEANEPIYSIFYYIRKH